MRTRFYGGVGGKLRRLVPRRPNFPPTPPPRYTLQDYYNTLQQSKGRLDKDLEAKQKELMAIENQTEIVLEGASPEWLQQFKDLAKSSDGAGKLVSMGHPRTTLERLFLEETTDGTHSDLKGS